MKKGVTLIELIAVIVIVGIIAAIAIPQISITYRAANESAAKGNLEIIAAADETYATVYNGDYGTENQLRTDNPPFLHRDYCGKTIQGFTYTCTTMDSTDYFITATPSSCNSSGSRSFTICDDNGGAVVSVAGCVAPACP